MKSDDADIVVIVPAYHAGAYLPLTVESIVSQEGVSVRVVIVDDGSTDDTPEICRRLIEKCGSCVSMVSKENGGVASARNFGLAEALRREDWKFAMFLDQDDVLRPNGLAVLSRCLNENPDVDAVYGQACAIDASGNILNEKHRSRRNVRRGFSLHPTSNTGPLRREDLYLENPASTPGQMLLRRGLLNQGLMFDPDLSGSDDWDFYVRITGAGTLVGIPEATIDYRFHGTNTSKNRTKMRASGFRMRLKWLQKADWRTRKQIVTAYAVRILHRAFKF